MNNSISQPGVLIPRLLAASALCSLGVYVFSLAASLPEKSSPASPAAGVWSIVPSPNALNVPLRDFKGLACASASDCWAVGDSVNEIIRHNLIEHWNGTSWTVVNSPRPAEAALSILRGVTCVSGSDCWAVGNYYDNSTGDQALIEHWDGIAWNLVASPTDAGTTKFLRAVTCVSGSDCWAVGYSFNPLLGGSIETLIEHWNGASWTIVASPNAILGTTRAQTNDLYAVKCTSASDCWAVGTYFTVAVGNQSLIEHWDGTSWSIVNAPVLPVPAQSNYLSGVACASPDNCWAVGSYQPVPHSDIAQTLIEHWDGTAWSVVSSPNSNVSESNYLQVVTCVSGSDCWATGEYSAGTLHTLVEHWNGTAWSIVSSPNPRAGTASSYLYGIACTSTSDCWIAGFDLVGNTFEPLAEHWNGSSWSIVPTDQSPLEGANFLNGVSCVSASDCWAAGYSGDTIQTLIEHWNGSTWSVVSSPNTSDSRINFFQGLTCVSASDCWAVGAHTTDTGYQSLIAHWDGAAWAIAPNTDGPGTINALYGVACSSTSNCWAVGYSYTDSGSFQILIEHWDGTSWSVSDVDSSNYRPLNYLLGVACSSATDCWAIGRYRGVDIQTLILHWDGTAWTTVDSPDTSATVANFLNGVTCTSASDCWAVGYYAGSGASQTLIARWDGTSWAIVSSPNTSPAQNNVLNGVACASASDCSAAGYSTDDNGRFRTLIEHWDGTSWAIVTSPNTDADQNNVVTGVACAPASDCWAVGYSVDGTDVNTLTERYAPPPVQLTGVVSRKTHGSAGDFDIDLPLSGNAGIECRSGGANGNYTLMFTFANPLTSVGGVSVTKGTGSVGNSVIGSDAHQLIVDLAGVTNAQTLDVTLTSVSDAAGNFSSSILGTMRVLIGDTTNDGTVNSADIAQTKSQSGQPVATANFREDVSTDGNLNSADIALVKSKSGTGLE